MIWIKLLLYISIIFVINIIVSFLLSYSFRIKKEKRSFFSYNHVNELHKKMDWTFRFVFMMILIVVNILVIIEGYSIQLYIYTSLFYAVLDFIVRAFFEYKYSNNPKQSILTISNGIVFSLGLLIVSDYLLDYLG